MVTYCTSRIDLLQSSKHTNLGAKQIKEQTNLAGMKPAHLLRTVITRLLSSQFPPALSRQVNIETKKELLFSDI